jgi:DNA-binding CsgD family transcriptional regulator
MSPDFSALSERERECLYLSTKFMRPKEIAARLGRSPKTVEAHLARVVTKLGVSSTRQAAQLYSEYLNAGLSGETLQGTARLSSRPTFSPPVPLDEDAEGRLADVVQEPGAMTAQSIASFSIRRSLVTRWKELNPDDLTIAATLRAIIYGAIIFAVAIATVINMVGAFDQFASAFSRP